MHEPLSSAVRARLPLAALFFVALLGLFARLAPAQTPLSFSEIHVPTASAGTAYDALVQVKGVPQGSTLTWTSTGALPAGITLTPLPTSMKVSGTTSQTGAFPFVLTATLPTSNQTLSGSYTLFVNAAGSLPPAFETLLLDTARIGTHYVFTVSITPVLYAWPTIDVLAGATPSGIAWRHTTGGSCGTLFGTPNAAGTSRFVLHAVDNGAHALREFQLTVTAATTHAPLQITTTGLGVATLGSAYVQPLTATGGPTSGVETWSIVGTLPAGMFLVQSSPPVLARIGGTPSVGQTPGSRTLRVRVRKGTATSERVFRLHLNPVGAAITFEPPTLPDAEEAYDYQNVGPMFESWDGAFPTAFRIEGGTVPPGMSFYSDGWWNLFLGAPLVGTAAVAPFRFTVTAVDATGIAASREYTLHVLEQGIVTIHQGESLAMSVDQESQLDGIFNHRDAAASDHDAAPGSLGWSISSPPANGVAQILSGSPSSSGASVRFAYAPNAGFAGTDSFKVLVEDGDGHSDSLGVDVTVQGFANTFHWDKLNAGLPVGERHPDVSSVMFGSYQFDFLTHGSGAYGGGEPGITFALSSTHLGRYLARFTENAQWQLQGASGFTADPNVLPPALDLPYTRFATLDVVPHPDVAGGWIGVGQMTTHVGREESDSHGHFAGVVHDGTQWKLWNGGTAYDDSRYRQLFQGEWTSVNGGRSPFAFDAAHREGIAVGISGGFSERRLGALRVALDATTSSWTRWRQETGVPGHWHTDNSGYWGNGTVLDPLASTSRFKFGLPEIVHLEGTRTFLTSFLLQDNGVARAGLARYDGASQTWSFWNGATWLAADGWTTSYAEQIANVLPAGNVAAESRLVALPGGSAMLFVRANSAIHAVRYDAASGVVGASVVVATIDTWEGGEFVVGVRDDGVALVTYKPDAIRSRQVKVLQDGTVSDAGLIWASESRYGLAGSSWTKGEPVVFVREFVAASGSDCFTYALGERPPIVWPHETPIVLTQLQEPGVLAPPQATFVKTVSNIAGCTSYGSDTGAGIAADDQGYVYAPRSALCSVIVHSPDATSSTDNVSWGGFWDHFSLPGATAVYPERNRVFATTRIFEEGAGGLTNAGMFETWEQVEQRTSSAAWNTFSTLPDLACNPDYSPQFNRGPSGNLFVATGLAVDRGQGLLYVTSAAEHKVHVYDVLNTTNSSAQFGRNELMERVSGAGQPLVSALADELVAAGHLSSSSVWLTWESFDFDEVRADAIAGPSYAQLSPNDRVHAIRNLMRSFKSRRDLPVFLWTFSNRGSAVGQIDTPMSLSVDSMGRLYVLEAGNSRVQCFAVDRATQTFTPQATFGSRGRGAGELLRPVCVSASPDGLVFVTDPLNDRVNVYSSSGAFLYDFGSFVDGSTTRELSSPMGIDASRAGWLYLVHESPNEQGGKLTTFQR